MVGAKACPRMHVCDTASAQQLQRIQQRHLQEQVTQSVQDAPGQAAMPGQLLHGCGNAGRKERPDMLPTAPYVRLTAWSLPNGSMGQRFSLPEAGWCGHRGGEVHAPCASRCSARMQLMSCRYHNPPGLQMLHSHPLHCPGCGNLLRAVSCMHASGCLCRPISKSLQTHQQRWRPGLTNDSYRYTRKKHSWWDG